jgi:hypothetical protein
MIDRSHLTSLPIAGHKDHQEEASHRGEETLTCLFLLCTYEALMIVVEGVISNGGLPGFLVQSIEISLVSVIVDFARHEWYVDSIKSKPRHKVNF